MTTLALFVSTFMLVFALGFQSLNVNNGHYVAAFVTSFLIGASNLVLFKYVPDANLIEVAAYMMGGPFGIISSMYAHRRWMKPKHHKGQSK
jgi:general stress protein CsbA